MEHDNHYEDELDRMRARRLRKKGKTATSDRIQYSEDQDLDQNFDQDLNLSDEDDLDMEELDLIEPVRNHAQSRPQPGKGSARARVRRRKRKRRWLQLILLAVVLLAGYIFYQKLKDDSYWTIAVFGVDSRDGNLGKGALSDVEMICSVNKKTGEMRLVSVFRDSYLRINDDGDYDKINEAYFKGGHTQAVDALRANLDLQIDDYATFNWKAVINAINVLGGVDLEITDKEFAYINSFITETVNSTGIGSVQLERSGMNHLDGVQAVAYARLRLMDTDFNRTERQRKVLGLAMEKAKKADAKTLKNLIGAVYPEVSTSIGVDDLLGIAKNARRYYIGQTSGFPFSHQEVKVSKKSCVIPTTLESNVIQLHTFLYDNETYHPSATVTKISSHIAEKTGLGEPGKDIESGKNIGTEGNSGSGQAASQNAAAKPQKTEAAAENIPAESESVPESSAEETESSAEETTEESPEETTEAEHIAPLEPTTAETHPSSAQQGPGVKPAETGSGSSSVKETPGAAEAPAETNAVLEAPGQGSGSESVQQGPGAQ